MSRPTLELAVYGTLRRADRNHSFLAGATHLGDGTVAGRLYEMPESAAREYAYPALVLGPAGRVVVEVYDLHDAATLAAADELEAFDPGDEAASEYVRRAVSLIDGPVPSAWIYVYNGPRAEMGEVIPGGDWMAHLARTTG